MKFKDALVLEAVTHTDREKIPLEQKKIILKDVLNKIQNGQFKINLRNSRVSDIEYIARQLKISEKTVRNHISNAMQKLGVNGRASAVVELLKLGEISL